MLVEQCEDLRLRLTTSEQSCQEAQVKHRTLVLEMNLKIEPLEQQVTRAQEECKRLQEELERER